MSLCFRADERMPAWVRTSGDRFDLQRFVEAQAGVHEQVCAELRAGTEAEPLDVVRVSADSWAGE